MLAILALLPDLLLADLGVPPGPFRREDAIRTLAEANAVVLVASARCQTRSAAPRSADASGARADRRRLAGDPGADLEIGRGHERNAHRIGAPAWCDEASAHFGPDGTTMKGLRSTPQA